MWKNIDPGYNMSLSSQYKDFLYFDFIYSMVYSGLRLDMFHCIYYLVMLITARSTVSASTLIWLIKYIYLCNLQFLNNVND